MNQKLALGVVAVVAILGFLGYRACQRPHQVPTNVQIKVSTQQPGQCNVVPPIAEAVIGDTLDWPRDPSIGSGTNVNFTSASPFPVSYVGIGSGPHLVTKICPAAGGYICYYTVTGCNWAPTTIGVKVSH